MAAAEAPREPQIFVVPYCHADWAWTHTRHWHAERYTLVFEETLALLRAQEAAGVRADDPHSYRWYFDSFVTMLQPFLERRPDLLPELRWWVDAGRVAICGSFANMRPNCVEGAAFLRNLVLGRRAFQSLFPRANLDVHADLVDVAWGHPQLPQLLSLTAPPTVVLRRGGAGGPPPAHSLLAVQTQRWSASTRCAARKRSPPSRFPPPPAR